MNKFPIPQAMLWKYDVRCAKSEDGGGIAVWESKNIPQPNAIQISQDLQEYAKYLDKIAYINKRKTGSACLLSDILEESVDEKYFLSENQVKKMVDAFTLLPIAISTEGIDKHSPQMELQKPSIPPQEGQGTSHSPIDVGAGAT